MITYWTDTDTDITLEEANNYGYKLISMPYSVGEKTIYPYVDFEKFDSKTYYDMLRAGTIPTTTALTKEKYIEYFEPEFAKGNDICYVHFSKAMTATFGFMQQAIDELQKKYPERKFYAIDTMGITLGSYNIVLEIGDMILQGKSIEEILDWAKKEVPKFATYFYANDLKFFKRSGRVSGLAATMGTIFGVRPIIYMDDNGVMTNIGKERGKENAINRLIAYVEELGEDLQNHRIIVSHTDCLEDAEEVARRLREKFGENLNIKFGVVNPTAGAHCGPSGVGINFHAKHK